MDISEKEDAVAEVKTENYVQNGFKPGDGSKMNSILLSEVNQDTEIFDEVRKMHWYYTSYDICVGINVIDENFTIFIFHV